VGVADAPRCLSAAGKSHAFACGNEATVRKKRPRATFFQSTTALEKSDLIPIIAPSQRSFFRAVLALRAQPAKTTLFAGGNEANVRKTAAGQFFPSIRAEQTEGQHDNHRTDPREQG